MVRREAVKYFKPSEFACRCGCGKADISPLLVEQLGRVRGVYGKPMVVTSGVRCPSHNEAVGGKADSAHLSGLAVDVACDNSLDRWNLLSLCLMYFSRVGISKTFIHVDIDTSKPQDVCWLY